MKDQLERIITNFQEQQQAYLTMADMAQAQLTCLQKQQASADTMELTALLQARQGLLQEIDVLSRENKLLQEQVCRAIEVDEFVLRKLEGKFDEASFQKLKEAIGALALLLEDITRTDTQSHQLLSEGLKTSTRQAPSKAGKARARKAYEAAMTQGQKGNEPPL